MSDDKLIERLFCVCFVVCLSARTVSDIFCRFRYPLGSDPVGASCCMKEWRGNYSAAGGNPICSPGPGMPKNKHVRT